jgi:hypothetical protein
MPKCVELVAVYDDGTVARLGQGATEVLLRDLVVRMSGVTPVPDSMFKVWAEDLNEGVTKPLRRVTVVAGWVNYDDNVIRAGGDDIGPADLLLPEEVEGRGSYDDTADFAEQWYDFRITVEAVPVEEGKP